MTIVKRVASALSKIAGIGKSFNDVGNVSAKMAQTQASGFYGVRADLLRSEVSTLNDHDPKVVDQEPKN